MNDVSGFYFLSLIFLGISIFSWYAKNELDAKFLAFVGWIIAGLLCLYIAIGGSVYKRGQIDALTGKIHYSLVTNTVSETSWEKIKK